MRKTIVDDRFEELRGIERLQLKDINRLEWWVHKLMIRHWMHAAKICVRGLFAGERALTSQIFNGLGSNNVADDCFMNTVKDSAIRLFDFVDMISSGRRSPEKLFQILDLYQVLSDLLPEVETIFESKSGEFIRKLAVETLSGISEKARGILSEFEKTVFKEISQVPTREVSIHPMTRNVMSYIHDMVEHEQTLNQLILSIPSSLDHIRSSALDLDFSELEGTASPLVLHLIWIIVALKFNLQGKSRQYKDASLAHCFVMNNVDYTVQKIKGLRLGDDYENKLVSVAEANYQISTAKRLRILDCFKCGSF